MTASRSPLVIRPTDWPILIAALISLGMIALPVSEHVAWPEPEDVTPAPAQPAPKKPDVSYAPAPGRDDRTPLEFVSQVFDLDDPTLTAKLSGIGPVFWKHSGHGSGALIGDDLVLTTAHLFVKDGTWYGGNNLLPIPPDPAHGEIYFAACGRSYAFAAVEVGSEAPRKSLGLDYAIGRLIPALTNQNPFAQSRQPMDVMQSG